MEDLEKYLLQNPRVEERTENSYARLQAIIGAHVGQVSGITDVTGGLIHRVLKLHGDRGVAVLKIRGESPVSFPEERIEPRDIDFERDALNLLWGLEPAVFPRVLGCDNERGVMLLSDIMPEGVNLETRLNRGTVEPAEMRALGGIVGRIHRKLQNYSEPIRPDDEEEYRNRLQYTIGRYGHPMLDRVVEQVATPQQLTLTDLAPKNIGRDAVGNPTICDPKWIFRGDLRYALGYLAGHMLVHSLDNVQRANDLTFAVLKGIQDSLPDFDKNDEVVQGVALGSVIYRTLHHKTVPYRLLIPQDEREKKAERAFDLLDKGTRDWEEIIRTLTSEPERILFTT